MQPPKADCTTTHACATKNMSLTGNYFLYLVGLFTGCARSAPPNFWLRKGETRFISLLLVKPN